MNKGQSPAKGLTPLVWNSLESTMTTRPIWLGLAVALSTLLAACVTINIYFPAAEAEKAADKIIDEVWRLKGGEAGPTPPGAPTAPAPKPN